MRPCLGDFREGLSLVHGRRNLATSYVLPPRLTVHHNLSRHFRGCGRCCLRGATDIGMEIPCDGSTHGNKRPNVTPAIAKQ